MPQITDKQLRSLVNVFERRMGMSSTTARVLALKWLKSNFKEAMMSTFLHKAIEHQIDMFRAQSFAKFGLDIAVYPADGARSYNIWLPLFSTINIGYSSYIFETRHNDDPPKRLRVRLSMGAVEVHFCSSWHPISDYLNEVKTESNYPQTSEIAYDAQFNWWKTTGKSFDIMALPGEIRNAIFDQVFSPVARPYPSDKLRKRRLALKPDMSMMHLNKGLYHESSHRLYQTTTFLVEHGRLMFKLLKNNALRNRLRNVTLTLTNSGYFDFFRFDPYDAAFPHDYVVHRLRETNLAKLEINIAAPSNIAEKAWLEGACQKTVVDRIFDVAWSSIKGHPVAITGHVEQNQKQAIEARLKAAHEEYEKWSALNEAATGKTSTLREYDAFLEEMNKEPVGGVRLDGEAWAETGAEVEAVDLSYNDFKDSLKCRCERKCTSEN